MSRTVYGKFVFSNGITEPCMSHKEAYEYCIKNNCEITYDFSCQPIVTRRNDSFQSGWQPQLGMYVGGPKEYQKILREKGLVELDKKTPSASSKKPRIDDEFAREIKESVPSISDNELTAIANGEKLHKDAD